MASGRFSKQAAPYLSAGRYLNNGNGDTVIGGSISAQPSGGTATQGQQNLPGDRFIFSPADAIAASNNNTGNLYTGTYRYVATNANSTASPTRGRAVFWDLSANDTLYQVTPDEAANITVALFAGVAINNFTKGNYWFVQESGKATCKFRATVSATAAIGGGVYLAAQGAGNDVGTFDQASNNAANSLTTQLALDQAMVRFVGVAETLPSNNNLSIVDLTLSRASFRW